MVDPNQTTPTGGRGCGGTNNNGRVNGFTIPPPLNFTTNNNFMVDSVTAKVIPTTFLGLIMATHLMVVTVTQKRLTQEVEVKITFSRLMFRNWNYAEWSQIVRLILDGKEKLGFLTGDVPVPAGCSNTS